MRGSNSFKLIYFGANFVFYLVEKKVLSFKMRYVSCRQYIEHLVLGENITLIKIYLGIGVIGR